MNIHTGGKQSTRPDEPAEDPKALPAPESDPPQKDNKETKKSSFGPPKKQQFYGVNNEVTETDLHSWPIGLGPFRTPFFEALGLKLVSHESNAEISLPKGEVDVKIGVPEEVHDLCWAMATGPNRSCLLLPYSYLLICLLAYGDT